MNHNGITHRNHYIPQFYLKNWSKDAKTIYTYSLLVSNSKVPYWKRESIKNSAVWNDFYTRIEGQQETDDFEKWFDHNFESPARSVFDKLLEGRSLNHNEMIILSHFVAAQHLRTPARLNEILAWGRKKMPTLFHKTLEKASRELKSQTYIAPVPVASDANLIPVKISIDKDHNLAQVNSIVGKGVYLFALKHLLTDTLKILEHHQWTVIQAAEGISFPTSDDPVICLNYRGINDYNFKGGWGQKNGNIIMPISPKKLLFTQIGSRSSCDYLSNSTYWSKVFRKMIIEHAHRYVYAEEPQKGMLAINPRIVNCRLYNEEKESIAGWHEEQMRAENAL